MFNLLKKENRYHGFTLVEMFIAMLITGVGVIGTYALITGINHRIKGNSEVIRIQQESRNISERIDREVRESSPDKIWPEDLEYQESDYIIFQTPRDYQGKFIVDSSGSPEWQRYILYSFSAAQKEIYRFQLYTNKPEAGEVYDYQVISKDVEHLSFGMESDMLTISLRLADADQDTKIYVPDSYTEYYTMVKLRN